MTATDEPMDKTCQDLLDAFFESYPNDELRDQVGQILASLVGRGTAMAGAPSGWAGGIVYAVGREPVNARSFAATSDRVTKRTYIVFLAGRDPRMCLKVGASSIPLAQRRLSPRESFFVHSAHSDSRLEDVFLRVKALDPSLQDHLGSCSQWDRSDPLVVSSLMIAYQADITARHVQPTARIVMEYVERTHPADFTRSHGRIPHDSQHISYNRVYAGYDILELLLRDHRSLLRIGSLRPSFTQRTHLFKPPCLRLSHDLPAYTPQPHLVHNINQIVDTRSDILSGLIFVIHPEISMIHQRLLNGGQFIWTKIRYRPVPIAQKERPDSSCPADVGRLLTISHRRQLCFQPLNVLVMERPYAYNAPRIDDVRNGVIRIIEGEHLVLCERMLMNNLHISTVFVDCYE
jgi:hypothetical protein